MSVFPSTGLITDALNLIKNDTPKLALFTNNPGPTGSGNEVAGGSYARQAITFGSITGGAMSNTNEITFTDLPTAVITHWAIYDATTSGNILAYGELEVEIDAQAGETATFAVGDIDINLSGS